MLMNKLYYQVQVSNRRRRTLTPVDQERGGGRRGGNGLGLTVKVDGGGETSVDDGENQHRGIRRRGATPDCVTTMSPTVCRKVIHPIR